MSAGGLFGIDDFAVDLDLKRPSAGGDQNELRDLMLEFL
jgi:hypothetical protein